MGQRDAHFRALAAMARQAPVARVTRPRHPFLPDTLADRVEAHLHDAEAGRAGPASGAGTNAPSPLKAAGNPKAVPAAASAASTSASMAVASLLR